MCINYKPFLNNKVLYNKNGSKTYRTRVVNQLYNKVLYNTCQTSKFIRQVVNQLHNKVLYNKSVCENKPFEL